jgi:acetyltransferase
MPHDSLQRLFRPQSIAVVGASSAPEKAGYMAVKLLDTFTGAVYPVNPKASEILGHKAYPSLTAIGKPVDMVILAVPAPSCPGVLREAAKIGAGAAVVLGGGFGETGEEGQAIQDEMEAICNETGIRVLGPNTGGFADPINKLVASFSVSFNRIPAGSIGVVSQSGGISLILACMIENDGFGVSLTVGLGNSFNIDGADMIDYLAGDPNTKAIALYMEGLRDGRKLYEAVNRATRTKPVVALTIGRADVGEFAKSHTGNLVGSYELKAAALRQAGAVVVDNSNDLVDAVCALSLVRLRPSANPAVGMLVGQAGAGLLMLDLLKESGVNIPPLSEECKAKISEHMPAMHFISNPVDTGRRSQEEFSNILKVLNADASLDAILIYSLYEPTALDPVKLFREGGFKIAKPFIFGTAGETSDIQGVCRDIATLGVAPYKSPERSARAMYVLCEDAKAQHRKLQYAAESGGPAMKVSALPAHALNEAECKQVLRQVNLAAPQSVVCATQAEALQAFAKLNKPVIAKVLSAEILHKTEVGGVHLNIKTQDELAAALKKIDAIPCKGRKDYLIEEMAGPGVDLIVGGVRDPVFGPTVLLGMGGIMAELLKDVSMRVAPIQRADAAEMMQDLDGAALFGGWRGSPAVNKRAIEDALLAVSALMTQNDQVKELDINPLRASEKGVLALDAVIVTK